MIPLPAPHDAAHSVVLSENGGWVALGDRKTGGDASVVDITPSARIRFPAFDPLLERATDRGISRDVSLHGSRALLVLSSERTREPRALDAPFDRLDSEIWVAPIGGSPPDVLVDCGREQLPAIDVNGTVVARARDCFDDGPELSEPIVVEDFATGETREVKPRPGESLIDFEVAGSYLAVSIYDIGDNPESEDANGVAVIDWRTGRELFRAMSRAGEWSPSFDVTPDGLLALAQTKTGANPPGPCGNGPQRFEWWSLTEPRAHPVRLRSDICLVGELKLANGYFLGHIGGVKGPPRHVLQRLDGSPPLAIGEPQANLGAIDFDGTRIARLRDGCTTQQVVLDDVESVRAHGVPAPERCPFELNAVPSRIRLGERRSFDIHYRCRAGCGSGVLGVEWFRSRDGAGYGSYSFQGRPGRTERVRVRVPSAIRRRVRDKGRLDIRLIAGAYQPDGSVIRRVVRTRLLAR